jgi:ATP-dependent Lhr-like helicase
VECAVLLKSALEKKIDTIHIPQNCLDVLSQHIYGIAIDQPRDINDVFKLVKQSHCFHSLKRTEFFEVIDYLSGAFASLETRHVYAKIWFDPETEMIGKRGKLARVIYMTNIGTIPDESKVKVKIGEYTIGTLDENFLERLNKGDVFVLGGQSYIFKYARGMTVQVSAAERRPPTVPSWVSEMLPLSYELALDIGRFRALMMEKFELKKSKKEILEFILKYLYVDSNAAKAIYRYFREQHLYAKIPNHRNLVVEQYKDGDLKHLIFHSLYGRRTNDALSRSFAFVLSKLSRVDVEIVLNDNGFILSSRRELPLDKMFSAVKADEFRQVMEMSIRDSEILRRRFRHCATRALMILRSYKGKKKTVGKQFMASRLLLYAVKKISEDFPILKETRREILEDAFDIRSALQVVEGLNKKKIRVKKIVSQIPSPFAFNLFASGYADIMKVEGRLAFIQRMHEQVMQKIGGKK